MFSQRDIVTHALETSPGQGLQLTERRCQVSVTSGGARGTVVEVQRFPFTIGKGAGNSLVLPDATVSREHCRIDQEGGSLLLRDLGSTNGTFLDATRVREAYLRPGMALRAGDVELRFEPLYAPMEVAPSVSTRFGELVGRSHAMRQIFALLDRVAKTDATVVLLGETGAGKGAVARSLHGASPRRDKPFVVVDCGAIADNLVESELFGHERGAFTGANAMRRGALELAADGTLFIDELLDLRLDLQPKLLRALEEREFRRLGSNQALKLEARVIAASRRDLWAEVQAGRFREDLYFRLAVFTIPLPPLRDRREDLDMLVSRFADELHASAEQRLGLGPDFFNRLRSHDWPGNVRELRNVVERALHFGSEALDPLLGPRTTTRPATTQPVVPVISAPRGVPSAASTPAPATPPPPAAPGVAPASTSAPPAAAASAGFAADYSLPFKEAKERLVDQFEAEYLRRLLARCQGRVAQAAREAGLDRKSIYNLMHKHGMAPSGDDQA